MKPSRVAGLISIGGAVISAALYLSLNDWFGSGDLPAMFVWSLPLGAMVAFSLGRALPRFAAWRPRSRTAALAAIGAFIGALWTFAAALLLGGWIGAFSFPVLYCWVAGGLLGGLAAARLTREHALQSGPPPT